MITQVGDYQVEVATDFGPRITGLRLGEGPQLFARLGPETAIEHAGGVFRFRGGHRLWVAPEHPEITYAPDDHECQVNTDDGIVSVVAPEDSAGVTKGISVAAKGDRLVVDHTLSLKAKDVAPWAVTQFPYGGTAIIPFTAVDTSPLPNRCLVTWPYSSLGDGRIRFGPDRIEIASDDGPPLKLGTGPGSRRLGYFRDGFVFIKEGGTRLEGDFPDMGAARQVYVGQGFCELETLDILRDLTDDTVATYREEWWAKECSDLDGAHTLMVET